MSRRVEFLRGTVLGTGAVASPGDVADVDDALALVWVNQGRAHYVDGAGAPEDPGVIQPPVLTAAPVAPVLITKAEAPETGDDVDGEGDGDGDGEGEGDDQTEAGERTVDTKPEAPKPKAARTR